MKSTRRIKNSRRTRRKQRGGARSIIAAISIMNRSFPPIIETRFNDINTIGELRARLTTQYPNTDIIIKYAVRARNNGEVLIEGAKYDVLITPIMSPEELAGYILNPKNTDISLIGRAHLKFASCSTGFQNFSPYRTAMKYYSEADKAAFFEKLKEHFGFEIKEEFVGGIYQFNDKAAIDFIKVLFADQGLSTENMDYIHIIFGEIEDIPGGPNPLYKQGVDYDHIGVKFDTLDSRVQEIILVLRDTVLSGALN